jgi:hypothetical protein
MKQLANFIEAHKCSKCSGSYRKGVIFDKSGAICRIFINFTKSKLDKHSQNYDRIFYAGRGKKDKDRYFIENTDENIENLRMKNNETYFPIFIRNEDGYFYIGHFLIEKAQRKKQYNPNLKKYFITIGFYLLKINHKF